MKKFLFVSALILGTMTMAHADSPRRWVVTTVTGTIQKVFEDYGYVKSINISTSSIVGSYFAAYSTTPQLAVNGGAGFSDIFTATTTIIPPIVYSGTVTVNAWSTGIGDSGAYVGSDFIAVQSNGANGGANKATVIWSK